MGLDQLNQTEEPLKLAFHRGRVSRERERRRRSTRTRQGAARKRRSI